MSNFPPANEGDLILPAWEDLQRWARQFRVLKGHGIHVRVWPDGTHVRADAAPGWPHRFKVGLSGTEARIGAGTVNGRFPTLNGVPLNGLDEKGNAVSVPALDLRSAVPKEKNGASWVGLQWRGQNAPCEVVALADDGEAPVPAGFHALARIEWENGFPSRKWQIAYLNLQAAAVEGRIYFWAA